MPHEIIIAMNVVDPVRYSRYREGMMPLLERAGGRFRYDMVVSQTLRTPTSHPITRVFSIEFPSRGAREAFFGDARYKAVRAEHFEGAVDGFTVMAEVDREGV